MELVAAVGSVGVVVAETDHDDPPEGFVGVPVTAAVEPVAVGAGSAPADVGVGVAVGVRVQVCEGGHPVPVGVGVGISAPGQGEVDGLGDGVGFVGEMLTGVVRVELSAVP